jgi:hypothetical protein
MPASGLLVIWMLLGVSRRTLAVLETGVYDSLFQQISLYFTIDVPIKFKKLERSYLFFLLNVQLSVISLWCLPVEHLAQGSNILINQRWLECACEFSGRVYMLGRNVG